MTKLKVVCGFSGSASSLRYLAENDPSYGSTYEVVGAFTDDDSASALEWCKRQRFPCAVIDFDKWCENTSSRKNNLYHRRKYYQKLLNIIKQYSPDIIILSGFMRIITDPLLSEVQILNVHPADLRVERSGVRVYTGDDAVSEAIKSGETHLCSTIHWLDPDPAKVDAGEIVCVSDAFKVVDSQTPRWHQEKMKVLCDGPAYQEAMNIITTKIFLT